MIKIFLCESKVLAKYILLYCSVITILYCMVITFVSFGNSALNDVKKIITENTEGSYFEVDTSVDFEELVPFHESYDIYNAKFRYSYNSYVLSGSCNGVPVSKGDVLTEFPVDDDINYGISSDELDENTIAISSKLANELGVTVGDEITYTIFSYGKETKFTISAIMSGYENVPDYLLNYGGMNRLLSNNSLSDKCIITFCVDDYETCRSIIDDFYKKGYSANSSLYDYIYDRVNVIYTTFSGLIAMSVVIGIAIVFVFVSFFMIILIKRKNFITLLIHSGMWLRKIVVLYWMVIETIHIIVSLLSIPFSFWMIKWISKEFYSTFEIDYSNIYVDMYSVCVIFGIVFLTLGISMLFFSRKLKKINYSITGLKGSIL